MLESTNDQNFIIQPNEPARRRHKRRHLARDRRQAARARARELAQQEEELIAFNAYVFEEQSFSTIGHALGRNRQVVAQLVANELDRRSVEFAHRRRTEIETNFAYLSEARRFSAQRMRAGDEHGVHQRGVVTAAREINMLFGLHSPAEAHLVVEQQPPPHPFDKLLQRAIAEDGGTGKYITPLLRMCSAARPESERYDRP